MEIFCKELNKYFDDKDSMLEELAKYESKIVELKKAAIKEADSLSILFIKDSDSTEKSMSFVKEGYVYPVINTTNFMDSHGDVHFPNIWNKTLKEKQNKIFYVLEHKLSIDNVIAYPQDVRAFVKTMAWSELGLSYNGETQALIFEIPKDKIKIDKIKDLFNDKISFENSVRMRYITISLAMNSENKDFAKQKKTWDDRINLIANKEEAERQGYFWAVDEAGIEKEGSLVLFGSNSATPVIYQKEEGADDSITPKNEVEPSQDTLKPEEQKKTLNLNVI